MAPWHSHLMLLGKKKSWKIFDQQDNFINFVSHQFPLSLSTLSLFLPFCFYPYLPSSFFSFFFLPFLPFIFPSFPYLFTSSLNHPPASTWIFHVGCRRWVTSHVSLQNIPTSHATSPTYLHIEFPCVV